MDEQKKKSEEPSLGELLFKLFLVLFIVMPITFKILSVAFGGRLGKILLWTMIVIFAYNFIKMLIKTSPLFGY